MAPMKIYGWAVSPWMARALVCLEEAGAEYEIVPMSRCGGDHRRPDHLARNVRISLLHRKNFAPCRRQKADSLAQREIVLLLDTPA